MCLCFNCDNTLQLSGFMLEDRRDKMTRAALLEVFLIHIQGAESGDVVVTTEVLLICFPNQIRAVMMEVKR